MGVLPYFHCHYAKPIVIAEFGAVEGNRPPEERVAWLAEAYRRMNDFPYLRAAVYFNDFAYHNQEAPDFRMTEGSAYRGEEVDPRAAGWQLPIANLTSAYRAAIHANDLLETVPPLNQLTPAMPYCGDFPPVAPLPAVAFPTQIMVAPGGTTSFTIEATGLEGAHDLTLAGLPQGVEGHIIPATLTPDSTTATVSLTVPTTLTYFRVMVQGTGDNVPPLSITVDVRVTDALQHVYLPTVRVPQ